MKGIRSIILVSCKQLSLNIFFSSKPFFVGKTAHLYCMPLYLTIVC